ncbi:tRNA(Phe) (4-demethylwyosine(37)-C(7)) aminocarboxypropyltransferase Taw2 [Methanocaldococcus indicus]|uniref:tRNA(Phe) (4-demethylwyosine(37)-C(7)) aminocarboxypropyltransferase Taw2 n=1 Tax=Methanocaldococcus indicus TaxID=213231 RepID=UPI003C6D4F25
MYQKIGDILVVKRDLSQKEIETLVNKTKCKTIVRYTTQITGEFRTPNVKILFGKETETIHKEHKCLFKLDVAKIMWSQGNIKERERIAKISNKNEIVIDMFAGIGYFSIPIAKYSQPKKIYSIEKNPISFYYLTENVKLNKLKNVVPILSDNRDVDLKGDRIIMGYIHKTHKFLDKAFSFLKDVGYIHYHETVAEKVLYRPIERLKYYAEKNNYKLESYNLIKVKKYAPGVWHVVVDAKFCAYS